MCEEKEYHLNIDDIKKSFRINNGGINHSHSKKIKLLPYNTDEKNQMINFKGVASGFSRIVCNKKLMKEFNSVEFIDSVADKVAEYESDQGKLTFKDIVKSMFLDDEELIAFDIKTINYISSSKDDEKVSRFLYSIFFTEELKDIVKNKYDKPIDNILYKLVLESLPELSYNSTDVEEYKCYLPFIRKLFIEDFKFIIKNEELYKNSLKRFLEYYYMFYISQLSVKLSKFEKADLLNPEKIYYTLNWERTSKNRTAYKFGWELLNGSVSYLFSHVITLEMLNHHNLGCQLGYVDLFNVCELNKNIEIEKEIDDLTDIYISAIKDIDWGLLTHSNKESGNSTFDKIYKLFEVVDYQFNNSTRVTPYGKYKNKFSNFVYKNFAKMRGPLKYNLNITEEDIILMTKICIKDKGRLKLNFLFDEFEARGMFFDRDSKMKIIQLYEKLNLLEKKSDSGDAQYVRSIL